MDNQTPADVEFDRSHDWPDALSAVRAYWTAKRQGRLMPSRADMSPRELRRQLPDILLADVIDEGADFRYRVVGTRLEQFFASNPTGKPMSEALAPFGDDTVVRTLATYRRVAHQRAPLRITGSGSIYGQDPKSFDAWLAPLSDDGSTVNIVLGTFVFYWDFDHQFRAPQRASAGGKPILPEA